MFWMTVLIVVLIVGVGMGVTRGWTHSPRVPEPTPPAIEQAGMRRWVRQRVATVRQRLPRTGAPQQPATFRAWAIGASAAAPARQAWLEALAPAEIEALHTLVDRFCQEMGLDLAWLIERRLSAMPLLDAAAEQLVLDHIALCQQASTLQDEIATFRALLELEQQPERHAPLLQALVGTLIDEGLASLSITEHLRAPADLRQAQLRQVLHDAVARDPQRASEIVRTVIKGSALDPRHADGGLIATIRARVSRTPTAAPAEPPAA